MATTVMRRLGFCLLLAATCHAKAPSANKLKGPLFGALVADALCLGSHYEYDATKIKRAYGGQTINKFLSPGEKMGGKTHGVGWGARNYHEGKVGGEQTDYGDYNVVILEALVQQYQKSNDNTADIDPAVLLPHWAKRIQGKWGWRCTQTRQTLQQYQSGTPFKNLGGMSNAMAIRNAGAFGMYETEAQNVQASRTAMFTHKNQEALGGGEFFTRVAHRILWEGLTPAEAIDAVAKDSSAWFQSKVKLAKDKVKEATDPKSDLSKQEFVDDLALTSMARLWEVGKSEPIKVGKASPTEGTLPGSIYFILKYNDLVKAAQANAMVGGDNASRAIAIGMVLGAYQGADAIPQEWKNSLAEWKHCNELLDQLPLIQPQRDEL